MPRTSGPLATVARLTISATHSSDSLTVTSADVTTTSAQRVVADALTSELLVVQAGRIVAETHGSGDGVPLLLTPGVKSPAQGLPHALRLTGCATGRSLAAGRYTLVGVLGYQVDPLNNVPNDAPDGGMFPEQPGSHGFVLVSSPVPVTLS